MILSQVILTKYFVLNFIPSLFVEKSKIYQQINFILNFVILFLLIIVYWIQKIILKDYVFLFNNFDHLFEIIKPNGLFDKK